MVERHGYRFKSGMTHFGVHSMQTTGKITRESLMTLEAYTKYRKENKPAIMAHRKLRLSLIHI